jgi:transposase
MEATIFTGWIYDFLAPFALDLKVAHPEMLKAITAAKKKNNRADAEMITDLLRVNLLPQCHMLPEEIRELRRILRYRNHVVRTAVKMQNKMSGLLMEVGASYSKKRLHGKKYFHELLERVEEIPPSVKDLLKLSRASFEMFREVQKRLIAGLRDNDLIRERVRRLMTIQGVGEVTALTWALEIGDPSRFSALQLIFLFFYKNMSCERHLSRLSGLGTKNTRIFLRAMVAIGSAIPDMPKSLTNTGGRKYSFRKLCTVPKTTGIKITVCFYNKKYMGEGAYFT